MNRRDLAASRSRGLSAHARNRRTECRVSVCCCHMLRTILKAKSHLTAFTQELKRHGWSEDRNIHIDTRFSAGMADQYPLLAKELATLQLLRHADRAEKAAAEAWPFVHSGSKPNDDYDLLAML
jgi:hypothetical protein